MDLHLRSGGTPRPGGLAAEVAQLPAEDLLVQRGPLLVGLARAERIPQLLREIGRCRELTFRAAGEGTGAEIDLDPFDATYEHLFCWHRDRAELVGAYRVGRTDQLSRRGGPSALYTHTLFDYDAAFLARLGPALELGRSFVRPDYQRSSGALVALWRGIARIVARDTRYRRLFGPVSIPALYTAESRALIEAVLLRAPSDLRDGVRPRCPMQSARVPAELCRALDDPAALAEAVARLEPDGKGLPVLVREYLKLGGRFLAFSIDHGFSGVLDGLVSVDLTDTEPRLLAFYMGRGAAHVFRARHAHS